MKKILLLISVLLIAFTSFSQDKAVIKEGVLKAIEPPKIVVQMPDTVELKGQITIKEAQEVFHSKDKELFLFKEASNKIATKKWFLVSQKDSIYDHLFFDGKAFVKEDYVKSEKVNHEVLTILLYAIILFLIVSVMIAFVKEYMSRETLKDFAISSRYILITALVAFLIGFTGWDFDIGIILFSIGINLGIFIYYAAEHEFAESIFVILIVAVIAEVVIAGFYSHRGAIALVPTILIFGLHVSTLISENS